MYISFLFLILLFMYAFTTHLVVENLLAVFKNTLIFNVPRWLLPVKLYIIHTYTYICIFVQLIKHFIFLRG